MRNFRQLRIWSSSIQLVTTIYGVLNDLPKLEKFGLRAQMARSAVSIPSNIAEGCSGSDKQLVRHLNIALGSSFELETQLEISRNIHYLDRESQKNVNGLYVPRKPLSKTARRAGWQGFYYDLTKVQDRIKTIWESR